MRKALVNFRKAYLKYFSGTNSYWSPTWRFDHLKIRQTKKSLKKWLVPTRSQPVKEWLFVASFIRKVNQKSSPRSPSGNWVDWRVWISWNLSGSSWVWNLISFHSSIPLKNRFWGLESICLPVTELKWPTFTINEKPKGSRFAIKF